MFIWNEYLLFVFCIWHFIKQKDFWYHSVWLKQSIVKLFNEALKNLKTAVHLSISNVYKLFFRLLNLLSLFFEKISPSIECGWGVYSRLSIIVQYAILQHRLSYDTQCQIIKLPAFCRIWLICRTSVRFLVNARFSQKRPHLYLESFQNLMHSTFISR